MYTHSILPTAMLKSILKNRNMIYMLAKREISARYRGSMMGILWSILLPLCMLAIYSFVYGTILKVRWSGSESQSEFALILFAGMLIFSFFSECINRASTIILANANYVKKVVFPLEIFPCVIFVSALFQLTVSLLVWLVFYFILHGSLQLSMLYLPILLFPLALLILGISWFLASLGVYIRDIAHVMTLFLSTLMFITPVFYPISAVPKAYHALLYLNPLTFILEQARMVLIWGQSPQWNMIGVLILGYGLVAWLGFVWFQMTRKGFADVL